MTKFRKRPLVIDAIKYDWDDAFKCRDEAQDDIADFVGSNISTVGDFVEIPTLEGVMQASKGDWIIKGVSGEFYPCRPDIFEMTYDSVE